MSSLTLHYINAYRGSPIIPLLIFPLLLLLMYYLSIKLFSEETSFLDRVQIIPFMWLYILLHPSYYITSSYTPMDRLFFIYLFIYFKTARVRVPFIYNLTSKYLSSEDVFSQMDPSGNFPLLFPTDLSSVPSPSPGQIPCLPKSLFIVTFYEDYYF